MVNVHYKIKYQVKFLVDSACTQLHSIIVPNCWLFYNTGVLLFPERGQFSVPYIYKKGLIFLEILTSSKILSTPWTDFPYSVFTAISGLPLKNEQLLCKKKGEESLFSWLLLSDVFKVFRYSFSEAMPIFFNTSRMLFSFSDRYKIFISDWLWIEVCQNTYSQLKAYCQPWCIARREHKAIRSKKIVIRSSGSG